ncbi:MAG: hypothetical protein Q9221_002535 [Calogaya cf. arnoldii]
MALTNNTGNDHYRRIGRGNCGSVWAVPVAVKSDDTRAIKREDGDPARSVYKEDVMQRKVFNALLANHCSVSVPRCHLYCPPNMRSQITSSEENQDCLVRLYLGRMRRLERDSKFRAFSLRNYPLHLDQIQDLGLDFRLYARILADALAHLYWKAHVDANDVEFVLAPPWNGDTVHHQGLLAQPTIIGSALLGEHVVWILDFDLCRDMAMDEGGVEQAVKAFCRNNPYFPKPGRTTLTEQDLWTEFKDRFLGVSKALLGPESSGASLPALWVDLVEKEGRNREHHHRP